MEQAIFHDILILLGVAVFLLAIFRYLNLPLILAYLIAGVLVGPYGLAWIPSVEGTRYLAEFGLVFLMFTIGLEFSLSRLVAMRRYVVGLGGAQVFVSFAVFAMFLKWWGLSTEASIVIGAVMSLSSTAIVMKLLTEQLEQTSRHGQYAFSVLLFQDLIVVPFLILVPALSGDTQHSLAYELGKALVKSVLVLVFIFALGRWLLRPLLHQVAEARSREMFMLTVLLLTLSAAWMTHTAGLSLALGAFLAGMMLGETEYRHQVEGDILPFRDVLLGLFFITVGMLFNPGAALNDWAWVLAALFGVIVFKGGLIFLLGKLFSMETGVAIRTGLILAQGGEFSFALIMQSERYQILPEDVKQVVLAAILLSMALAPLIVRYNGAIAKILVPSYTRTRSSNLDRIREEARAVDEGHVIICGYGRSGQNLAWMLEQEGINSLALDLDAVRVRDARDAGKPVAYGDVARRDVLLAAGLERARAMSISFNDVDTALRVLELTRSLRPDMPVVVRTMNDEDLELLYEAGATEVVPESLEGSLMMGSHVLLLLGAPMSHIIRQIRDVRGAQYRMLRGYFHGQEMQTVDSQAYQERLHSINLVEGARAVGSKLKDIGLDQFDVKVTMIRRGVGQNISPDPDLELMVGDVLVLYGGPASLEDAERHLLEG